MIKFVLAVIAMAACGGIAWAGESPCLPANGVIMLQPTMGYVAQPCFSPPAALNALALSACLNCPDGVSVLAPSGRGFTPMCPRLVPEPSTGYVEFGRSEHGRCLSVAQTKAALPPRPIVLPPSPVRITAPMPITRPMPPVHAPPASSGRTPH